MGTKVETNPTKKSNCRSSVCELYARKWENEEIATWECKSLFISLCFSNAILVTGIFSELQHVLIQHILSYFKFPFIYLKFVWAKFTSCIIPYIAQSYFGLFYLLFNFCLHISLSGTCSLLVEIMATLSAEASGHGNLFCPVIFEGSLISVGDASPGTQYSLCVKALTTLLRTKTQAHVLGNISFIMWLSSFLLFAVIILNINPVGLDHAV